MPVSPTSGIGTNLPLSRSLYFRPYPFDESSPDDLGNQNLIEEAAQLSVQAPLEPGEALTLAQEVAQNLAAKPARLASKIHHLTEASLLGWSYV